MRGKEGNHVTQQWAWGGGNPMLVLDNTTKGQCFPKVCILMPIYPCHGCMLQNTTVKMTNG